MFGKRESPFGGIEPLISTSSMVSGDAHLVVTLTPRLHGLLLHHRGDANTLRMYANVCVYFLSLLYSNNRGRQRAQKEKIDI